MVLYVSNLDALTTHTVKLFVYDVKGVSNINGMPLYDAFHYSWFILGKKNRLTYLDLKNISLNQFYR